MKQTMISEGVLQLIALYYEGHTVHFATQHGFYLVHHFDGNPPKSNALMMYVPALMCILGGVLQAYLGVIAVFIGEDGKQEFEGFLPSAVCGVVLNWLLN